MQHRIAFTTVQAEPGKPVLQQSRWMTGRRGQRGEGRSTVWCGEWDCCILRRLWQQREIHQWGKAVQQCNLPLPLPSSLLQHCVAQITFVIVTVMRIEFSLQLATARTVGCVSVCAIYLWQHQTPLTCGTHNLCLLLLLWATSQVPLSGTDWVSTVTGYRIQLIIFNWIRWPDLKLCLKATEIICAYKSL